MSKPLILPFGYIPMAHYNNVYLLSKKHDDCIAFLLSETPVVDIGLLEGLLMLPFQLHQTIVSGLFLSVETFYCCAHLVVSIFVH